MPADITAPWTASPPDPILALCMVLLFAYVGWRLWTT
jgi:hypothetical protein